MKRKAKKKNIIVIMPLSFPGAWKAFKKAKKLIDQGKAFTIKLG